MEGSDGLCVVGAVEEDGGWETKTTAKMSDQALSFYNIFLFYTFSCQQKMYSDN